MIFIIIFYKPRELFQNYEEEEEEVIESEYKKYWDSMQEEEDILVEEGMTKEEVLDYIYNFKDLEHLNSLDNIQKKFYYNTDINLNDNTVKEYNMDSDFSFIKKKANVYGKAEISPNTIPTNTISSNTIINYLDEIKDDYNYPY